MSLTRLDDCQLLPTRPGNYTLTDFADHVKGLSHERISCYLAKENVTAADCWDFSRAFPAGSRHPLSVIARLLNDNQGKADDRMR